MKRRTVGICVVSLATILAMGCQTDPVVEEVQQAAMLETVVLHPELGFTDEDVDVALEDGLSWEEMEDLGMITVESWSIDEVPVEVIPYADDGLDTLELGSEALYASGVYTSVPAGSTVYFTWSISYTGYCYHMYGMGRNTNTSNYINNDKARADYYRYSGSWDWKGSDYSTNGVWDGYAWCGAACSKMREKVKNLASSATHRYDAAIYLEYDAGLCGH